MQLSEFLDFDAVKPALSAGNKRSLLQQVAQLAAQRLNVDPAPILASIVEREQLGSTGLSRTPRSSATITRPTSSSARTCSCSWTPTTMPVG